MDNNKNAIQNYTEDERNDIIIQSGEQYHKMMQNGQYKELLVKFGENGKYSLSNLLYMLSQNPDMTVAKGMNEWVRLGRHIKEGANSMEIIAPTKIRVEEEVKNEDGIPKLDESGNPIIKRYDKTDGFHPMYLFDIADTEGDEYKPLSLNGKVTDEQKKTILDGIYNALSAKRYKYKFTDASEFGEGETYRIDKEKRTLKIKKGMDNNTTVFSAIEGASRAITESYKGNNFEGMTGEDANNLESSSRNCILAAHFGLNTAPFNFDSVKDMNEEERDAFRDNLGLVCAGTKLVMDRISVAFYKAEQVRETAPAENEVVGEPFRPSKQKSSEMEVA